MEDTLGEFAFLGKTWGTLGLNPCSNGKYSRRPWNGWCGFVYLCVLILVLMEDTLGEIGKIKPAATLVS